MADDQGSRVGIDLAARILFFSGLLFCIVGIFLILFVTTVVGIVLLVIGLTDLTMSFVIPKITGKQA